MPIMESTLFTWIVVPLLICCARIIDVSIGTVRIILVSKGNRLMASVLGFFEVIIWLIAITQVMQHLSNYVAYVGYGLGFALGNYVGISIEEKLALGYQALRFISRANVEVDILTMALRDAGFGATVLEAKGGKGKVHIIFTIIPRKSVADALDIAREIDPEVFVSAQDIRSVSAGHIPFSSSRRRWHRITKKK